MCSIKIVSTVSTLLKYRLKKRNHIKWCEFKSQKNLQRKENKIFQKYFQKNIKIKNIFQKIFFKYFKNLNVNI